MERPLRGWSPVTTEEAVSATATATATACVVLHASCMQAGTGSAPPAELWHCGTTGRVVALRQHRRCSCSEEDCVAEQGIKTCRESKLQVAEPTRMGTCENLRGFGVHDGATTMLKK
eukprot:141912-Chlamydomonas_euryale.AAC.6